MSPVILVLVVLLKVSIINGAKILGIITIASVSHHLPYRPLWRELAQRGHQVTVITTDPQNNVSNHNIREIDISYTYKIYEKHDISTVVSNENNRYSDIASVLQKLFFESHEYMLNLPEVQELLHNKNINFDVLLIEAHMPNMLAFAWRFKCPVIAIASLDPALQYHDSLGNIVHPVLNPDPNLDISDSENLSFIDRLRSFIYVYGYKYVVYYITFPTHHEHMKKYFGDDLPSFQVLQDNISLMFTGTHPLFHNMRPMNLNTIPIGGGMHLQAPKNLPKDLQRFLDNSPNGAVYFSLGSNVKANLLSDQFKRTILETFAEIPYRVVLKMDCNLTNVTNNILIKKWMPQQDVLRHPNIKLFITQGGLQSLQEAIYNGVPLIGIPFFGDQITNVNRMVRRGYGVKVDKSTISKTKLLNAIKEVMYNSKYRDTAKAMGEIFRDEEVPSLQRAVYWTEYVIRHKGARHLKSSATGMPAWKYYMVDVIGFLIMAATICLSVVYFLIRLLASLLVYIGSEMFFIVKSNEPKIKYN